MSVLELKGNLLQLLARLESEKRLQVLFETAQRFVKEEDVLITGGDYLLILKRSLSIFYDI